MAEYELSEHARKVIEERSIQPVWIDRCLDRPARTEPDPVDPLLVHKLLPIEENENRVLRIVYNDAKKPILIVTVYFDRKMKGKL